MARPSGPSSLAWTIFALLLAVLAVGITLLGLEIAGYIHLRNVESKVVTEGDLPPPPPVCNCCNKCATTLAYQCACCHICPDCDGHVSSSVLTVTENIITKTEGGNSFPPDTIMAVGNDDNDGRIIAVVNRAVAILNKRTHTRISIAQNFYSGAVPGGDPYVTWDAISSRFFLTAFQVNGCRGGLITYSPPAVAGTQCVGDARFGPSSFNINAITQVGSPLNGCAAMASLTGKIAIITRGVCGFAVKTKNAQNAGAIGVIIVNNVESTVTMAGTDPTIVIPTVSVALTPGNALIANAPTNSTIRSGGVTTYSTTIYISVSNTSSPNTRADFAHYAVSDGVYATQFVDYPKHSTNVDTLFISTQNFGNDTNGVARCIGPNIRAFDKAALMSGAGAVTLWSNIVPGGGVTGPIFMFPAETRTPISDQTLPAIFVGLGTGNSLGFCDTVNFQPTPATSLHIRTGTAAGLGSYLGVVPLPTPMDFGVCYPSPANLSCIVQPTARQPPPVVPYNIENSMGFAMGGIVYEGLLYTVLVHNISDVQSVVRWFIIDVSPVALGLQPALLQWGDLNFDPNIDTYWPHIDVTDDGTLGIVFYASGPTHPVAASYTFRLESDAPNSIRTPFHTAVPNVHTYFEDGGSRRNRYGDYTGLQVDPVDRQTFYGYTQRPNPLGLFNPPNLPGPCFNLTGCVARDWTTDLFTFRVDVNECPTDGVETTSHVLPSLSPQTGAPPIVGPAADRAMFSAPQTDDCIMIGQKRPPVCII